ncbi:tape measure domain-containing protein [Acinetobacter junii]|uniref:tape measure domain-containing protein n=1 Tax=Acinetobacter junii TaxID=40215 RepID=UPI003C17A992
MAILIGEMDQANGASATLAQWLSTLADNLDIVRVMLDDIGDGFVWFGDQLKKIDTQTIEALKTALLSAYDAVKSLGSSIGTVFETTGDVLNTTLGQIFNFSSGIDAAADKTNGFTKALQAVNVVFGFISDGFKALNIGINLIIGAAYDAAAAFSYWKSKITFGDTSAQAVKDFEVMSAKAREYYKKSSDAAMEFKSAGVEALNEIGKTQAEKDQEAVASSKAKLDSLLADQNAEVEGKKASEDEKLAAVQKYAELAIKANGGVIDGTMQADLLTKGYIVTLDQAGKVAVSAWDAAATGANKTSNETDKARKAAAALGIDLYELKNGITESFNNGSKALTDFSAGLQGLGIEGKQAADVTYEAWLKWLETAKSQNEIDVATFKLKEFGDQGKISTDQVEQGLIKIKFQAQKLPDDIDPVTESFKRLGIETKENLKLAAQQAMMDFINVRDSGKATAEGVEKAYKKALDAAAASGDASVIASANAAGAGRNLQVQIDETGKASVKSMNELSNSVENVGRTARGSAADGFRDLGRVAREEAKSTADEWIDAMAKVDAKRKAQAAETAKGLGQLADGQNQMAQNFYDQLIAGGMEKGRAEELKNEAITRMNNQLRTALNGGSASGAFDAKIGRNESQAWMQEILDGLDSKGSIGSSSPKITAPNIEAPSIQQFKMPNIDTGPSKTVTYRFEFGGQDIEFQGDPSQQDMVNSFFNQLEQAKKRM